MNGASALAGLLAIGERNLRRATEGLTTKALSWAPPGTANPIGATWLHALAVHDWGIHLLHGQPSLWDRDGWSDRLGVAAPLRQDYAAARAMRLDPEAVRSYADAVFAAARAFMEGMADADLDRTIETPERRTTVGEGLQLLVAHLLEHTGEIMALRGALGE
ncbi:MAG: DinB family protein [Chloroflexota bacterium]|nr:DinB family protein [Dehalococcoidia bacterium]MDW8255243.1 DinB family protein [Chloroflexota bacterium]